MTWTSGRSALGSRCARGLDSGPDRQIVSTSGGGSGQYMGEFTAGVKYEINIAHILLNNSERGKISKEQRAGEWEV